MRSSASVTPLHFACLLIGSGSSVAAQQIKGPPPYLQIFQEEVKVGRAGAHPTAEAGWPRAFAKAKIPGYYIAMTTLYGPDEAWFCAGVRSIAEIEQQNQAAEKAPGLMRELDRLAQADAANISAHRSLLGRYHPELSNGPEINPAEMRFWEALIFKIRPGHEGDFAQATSLYRSTVSSAKTTLPWATYEVMAGMPGPVFIVFIPHKALAEIDPATGAMAAIEKAMNEETMRKFGTLFEGFNSVENRIFAVSPEMSYPVPEWVTQDPEFWGRKPKPGS
jgi:hypothetical protein